MESEFNAYVPKVRDGFLWEPIPDGCMLFHESTGKLVTLNASAEAILTYCDGERNVAEICRMAASEFEIGAAESERILKQLLEEGVI